MVDVATLEARLAEAETALHEVVVGGKVATVSSNGRSVTYTQADVQELRRYIQGLRVALGRGTGTSVTPFF
jgi:hypothetical protein